jgi:hypothetical protein
MSDDMVIVLRAIVNYRVNFSLDSKSVLLSYSIGTLARAPNFQTMEPQAVATQVRFQAPFRLPYEGQGFGRQSGQFPLQPVMCL